MVCRIKWICKSERERRVVSCLRIQSNEFSLGVKCPTFSGQIQCAINSSYCYGSWMNLHSLPGSLCNRHCPRKKCSFHLSLSLFTFHSLHLILLMRGPQQVMLTHKSKVVSPQTLFLFPPCSYVLYVLSFEQEQIQEWNWKEEEMCPHFVCWEPNIVEERRNNSQLKVLDPSRSFDFDPLPNQFFFKSRN